MNRFSLMSSSASLIQRSRGSLIKGGGNKRWFLLRPIDNSVNRFVKSNVGKNMGGNLVALTQQQHQKQQEKQKESRFLSTAVAGAAYDQTVDVFPSIVIGPNRSIVPQGPFAESQAQYLDPDPEAVRELSESLLRTNMGIVAHYYMDVELQGVLHAVKYSHPDLLHRVSIADSLKMGDEAVTMCQKYGTTAIACLGVDFMSESVAAILQKNQFGHIPVYRATSQKIGCSLAESAETETYRAWLTKAAANKSQPKLHVIYINTSLETKAISSSIIPTITCTSSNVLQTILQASAQIGPSLQILYGPDTYMGENLITMIDSILSSGWDDNDISQKLHKDHDRNSLKQLRDNINVYPNGNCIVHHMFGNEVVNAVRKNYDDCYVTAHLEVPGEMFQIAMEKSLNNSASTNSDDSMGVVGSTSNILNFISQKVEQHIQQQTTKNATEKLRLKFILGTEAGMVTSIVKSVQDILESTGNQNIEVEIIFPVAIDAISNVQEDNNAATANGGADVMSIVPGVQGGEGCSTAGGCATCPFMKMNDLDSLQNILDMVERVQLKKGKKNDEMQLQSQLPPNRLQGKTINGKGAIDLGVEPIIHMRELMANKVLSNELVQKINQY